MKTKKLCSALIAAIWAWSLSNATSYVDLTLYRNQHCTKTGSGVISSWMEDGWNAISSSVNESLYADNINSDNFWNTLHNSLEDGTFYHRVAGMHFSEWETGSELFLKAVYSSINEVAVTYPSTLPNGDPVVLSGKIYLPKNKKVKNIIIANHYTICSNREAPSHASSIEGIFAIKDYIVLMPDYIGYGISDSIPHPYLHLQSTVRSAIDMLKAAIPYLRANCYAYNPALILVGYSQGGAATLALQKELEEHYPDQYAIQKVFAGAGPYDLAATFDYYVEHTTTDIPCSLPMLIAGMNYGEDLQLNLNDFFQPILQKAYPQLIASKNKTMNEVNTELGNEIKLLLKPCIFHKQTYPTAVLYDAVLKNSIVHWTPQANLYMFHSTEDNMVPFLNSEHAKQVFDKQHIESIVYDFAPYGNHMNAAVTFFEKVYKAL